MAVSCGAGSTSSDGGAAVTPAELIDGLCGMAATCCERGHRGDGGRQCRAGLESLRTSGVYDPRAAAACMAALRSSSPAAACELVVASSSPCQAALTINRHPGNKGPGQDCS